MKFPLIFIFLFLLVLTPFVLAPFGYDNPALPRVIDPNAFIGNFSWNGNCLNGGVEIRNDGTICGQRLEVFNITSVNITQQNLTITDVLNILGDVFLTSGNGFVVGHSSQIDFGATPEFQILGTEVSDSSMGFAVFNSGASVAPDFRFLKSRGTTIGSNVLVQDGDRLGRIRFQGADGNDFNTVAAEFQVEVDGTASQDNVYGRFIWRTRSSGGLNEKMRLDLDGNLGIGTDNPSFPLDVNGIGRFIGTLFSPSLRTTSVDDFVSTANAGINFGGASKFINFETDATERMRIISDGKVGINTTSPEELLNVFGVDVSIMVEGDGVTRAGFKIKTNNVLRWDINSPSAQARLAFMNSSLSEIFSILQSGSVGIGTSDPDGLLNVFSGSAGTVTARPSGDDLVIEHSSSGGMSILTPNASTSTIIFGSPGDPLGADIKWNHDNEVFIIGSRKVNATLRFVSGGGVTALNINKNQNFDFQDGDLLTTGTFGSGIATTGNLFSTTGTFSGVGDSSFVGKLGVGLTSPTSELHIQGISSPTLHIEDTGVGQGTLILNGNSTSADRDIGSIIGQWDSNVVASINIRSGSDLINKDEGRITFLTAPAGGGIIERMRITEMGRVGIGLNAPNSLLHVNGTITLGISSFPQNLTMYSPDGTSWSCGVLNGGIWACN